MGPNFPTVKPERTPEGLEARLKPRGVGRYFSAAFLSVWLCGWLVGECFALWILVMGAASLLTGGEVPGWSEPAEPAMALMTGVFLIVWLTFWTFGGYAAARELLRTIWSEDRIVARADALVVHRSLGPFRSTKTIPRSDLRRIYAIARKCRLMAETLTGPVELTSLARGPACEELANALRREMGLSSDETRGMGSLPESWSEVVDAEGGMAIVENERQRRARARFAWGGTFFLATVALALVWSPDRRRDALPAACVFGALTVAIGWSAWRLTRTRLEWRIDPGRLRLRRRAAGWVKDLFEGNALELVETSDSDGDAWYTLCAAAAGAGPPQSPPRLSERRVRRRIAHEMDDPTVPRQLGAWLARRAGIPLQDRADPELRTVELAKLISRLESGGRLSRWIARRIPRP
jgi:hypothetical protein